MPYLHTILKGCYEPQEYLRDAHERSSRSLGHGSGAGPGRHVHLVGGPATGDIDIAANWGGTLPSVTGDTACFERRVAGALSLTYSSNALAGSAGNAGVTLSSVPRKQAW